MVAKENDRDEFISKLIDTTENVWLGCEFLEHVRFVLGRIPIDVLELLAGNSENYLPVCDIAFFAPDSNFLGRVLDSTCTNGRIVYLSPILLSQPVEDVRAVIAHELAHVFLNHEDTPLPVGEWRALGTKNEEAADQLAESWGFKLPNSYKNRL
jgi:hypothetical protein